MLFMVTNRRIVKGEYGDEEQLNHKFDYLYAYNNEERGKDKFDSSGKKGFEVALLAELNRRRAAGENTPQVGIYLHGYNNDYQASIDELVDLDAAFSKLNGSSPILIGFSWPSSGRTSHYLSDREEVRDSVSAFTRFLIEMNDFITKNEQDCFSSTFCIAHSMGNYMLRKGLEYLSDHLGCPTGRMLFDETVLLAPDIASKDIERDGKGKYIAQFSRRVHVYYTKHDRALKASSAKRFGANRLGRHGANDYCNLVDNVVVIDAKQYANKEGIKGYKDRVGEQVSVHSSHRYHEDILKDITQVLASIDREQIRGREALDDYGIPMTNHYRLK
ncbi:alpha/beta hydrolase [Vibrio maerlii]|uniref:alpha/beta hydrolase n=1 Tax=Vibrio maerlii TaxID=2231648 RepID=UPI000E3BA725|nr:alpha/beta hydrolase [Vibrio maerlii]